MDEVNVTNEILEKGIAYRDPVTGNIIDKSEYLSGNVKDKLVEAKAALEDHPEFQKNVDDLDAVQPERIPYGELSYRLGTTWIPSEFINNFADYDWVYLTLTLILSRRSVSIFLIRGRS